MLMTHEKKLLCAFILASKAARNEIIQAAEKDPETSGPLLCLYIELLHV